MPECPPQLLSPYTGVYIRVNPAISRPVAASSHTNPSAPPSLATGFALRRVIATTRDSDYSSRPHRLGGFATLPDGLSH
jgi:hypothetical protein